MKKIVYHICLCVALAALASCVASRQKINAVTQDGNVIYANSWQLQSYLQVHEKPPIN